MSFYENCDVQLKGRLQKIFSKDTIMLHKHGSGDGSGAQSRGRCCRLCGNDHNLRRLGDTYMREGVVERYDCLLSDCFGVKVAHSRSMICEQCIHQLRSTERFRVLVHAAFDRRSSNYSSTNTLKNRHNIMQRSSITSQTQNNEFNTSLPINKKYKNIELWNKKRTKPKAREIKNRNVLPITKYSTKKVNVSCIVCSHRYLMTIPLEGTKNFICSFCKMNQDCKNVICKRCNFTIPSDILQIHMNMHSRANYRRSNRNRTIVNNSSKVKKNESIRQLKNMYEELQKNYVQESNNCKFCGKFMKTPQLLEKHVTKVHIMLPLYQGKECVKTFKTKRDWQSHCLKHEKVFKP